MNETGRSPQDEALQRAIRQLEVADGPPAALDQRIRARAHAAVRRRRGLPLWLSAAASVFLVFFAASLWRYQGGEPLLPPALQEPSVAVSDRDDEMDIGAEMAETASTARSEEIARLEQAPIAADARPSAPVASAPAELPGQAPTASRQAPSPALRAQADDRSPKGDRAPMAPAEPPAASAQLPSRARAVAVPDPAPTPTAPAPAPRPSAPPTTADRNAGRSPAATSTFQSAEPMAGAAASEAFSAGADHEPAGRASESERKREAGPAVTHSDDRRELKADVQADEAKVVAPASLGESFPAACLNDTAKHCFERVRRLLDEDRREEALLLLRDTLERHELPAPDDLKVLLE